MTDAVERALDCAYAFIAQFRADELSEGRFQQWEAAKKAIKDAHVALASPALESAAVPDGWQLVPKEPTEEMLESGRKAYFGARAYSDTTPDQAQRLDYIAMLAAAPSPPVQPTEEPLTMSIFASRADLYAERAKVWPPLKKALWNVVTGEQLNDAHYINAYELTDKLYAAILAAAPTPPAQPVSDEPVAWIDPRSIEYVCNNHLVNVHVTRVQDGNFSTPLYTRPQPAKEVAEALRGMLAHSCVADAGGDMKTEEDHEAERRARAALASLSQEQG